MRIKKKCSEAQLRQRRANALAASLRPKKKFCTMSVEEDAKDLIRNYVADRKNKVDTLSAAIRARFG